MLNFVTAGYQKVYNDEKFSIYSLILSHVCTILQARVQTIYGVWFSDCEKQFCKCCLSAIIIVLVRRAGVLFADGITKHNLIGTTLD